MSPTPSTAARAGRGSIPARAGIGLRFQHHQAVVETRPGVAWLEVQTENYMGGGTPLRYLDAIRAMLSFTTCGALLMSMVCARIGSACMARASPTAVESAEAASRRRFMVRPPSLRPQTGLNAMRFDPKSRMVTRGQKIFAARPRDMCAIVLRLNDDGAFHPGVISAEI